MLSFLNGTYMIAIEFLDKNGQIITKYTKNKTDEDTSTKNDSNIEISRDVFSFIGMEIVFAVNKVPRVLIYSIATDEDFIKTVGTFYITVHAMGYADEKGNIPQAEQFSATFPATPVEVKTSNKWRTEWYCIMEMHANVFPKKEISFVPQSLLSSKYVYKQEEKEITKMVLKDGKWKTEKEKFTVNVLDLDNLKNFNENFFGKFLEKEITLSDAFIDLSKTTFHKPSDALLASCNGVTTSSLSNKSTVEALEILALQAPSITNGPYMQGTYFTFKKIRIMGENMIDSSMIQIIEPKGDIKNKNTNSSKEPSSVPYLDVSIDDFISYSKGPNGEFIFKDVKKDKKSGLSEILIKNTLFKNNIKFEYSTESPSKLTIGDPVIIFASFSGAKMYGGFVTEERLIFDHKIHGEYIISANPESLQKQTLEIFDINNSLNPIKTNTIDGLTVPSMFS